MGAVHQSSCPRSIDRLVGGLKGSGMGSQAGLAVAAGDSGREW
jgi:hypothetical protein